MLARLAPLPHPHPKCPLPTSLSLILNSSKLESNAHTSPVFSSISSLSSASIVNWPFARSTSKSRLTNVQSTMKESITEWLQIVFHSKNSIVLYSSSTGPVCNIPVAVRPGQDPNVRMELHFSQECSIMGGKKEKSKATPRCARGTCKKVLFSPIRCVVSPNRICAK